MGVSDHWSVFVMCKTRSYNEDSSDVRNIVYQEIYVCEWRIEATRGSTGVQSGCTGIKTIGLRTCIEWARMIGLLCQRRASASSLIKFSHRSPHIN